MIETTSRGRRQYAHRCAKSNPRAHTIPPFELNLYRGPRTTHGCEHDVRSFEPGTRGNESSGPNDTDAWRRIGGRGKKYNTGCSNPDATFSCAETETGAPGPVSWRTYKVNVCGGDASRENAPGASKHEMYGSERSRPSRPPPQTVAPNFAKTRPRPNFITANRPAGMLGGILT